jgi:hypothetical protein
MFAREIKRIESNGASGTPRAIHVQASSFPGLHGHNPPWQHGLPALKPPPNPHSAPISRSHRASIIVMKALLHNSKTRVHRDGPTTCDREYRHLFDEPHTRDCEYRFLHGRTTSRNCEERLPFRWNSLFPIRSANSSVNRARLAIVKYCYHHGRSHTCVSIAPTPP